MLFQLGPVTFDCPAGLNATGTTEEFGADFAVKAVVGAQQPREFVGSSDHGFTLTGDLFPYAAARAGQDTGLDGIEALRDIAASGDPQILVRGDGENLGWFLIERVTQTATSLSSVGVGRKINYTVILSYGAVCHLLAPGAIGEQVPRHSAVRVGMWVGIGVFVGMSFAYRDTLFALVQHFHPPHDVAPPP